MITLENISNYITGNLRWLGDQFDLLDEHEKEQVLWRASKCPPECFLNKACYFCGCSYPQKLYVNKSCNKDLKLPSLMNKEDWEVYKQKLKNEKVSKLH